uniref:Uncharacterized protein n=1 Tax=viral metagenome TaxID=1070528 RepID=A0A6C0EW13_9ZZZZ
MKKHSSKKNIHKKHKKYVKKTYKMKGGNYSQDNIQQLLQLGFTNDQIHILSEHIPNANNVVQALEQINPNTNANFTPQELMNEVNEHLNRNDEENILDISDINSINSDQHELDLDNDNSFNLGNDDSFDNNDNNLSLSMDTTRENISNASNNSDVYSLNLSDEPLNLSDLNVTTHSVNTTRDNSFGGKKSRSKKSKKSRSKKSKKSRSKKSKKSRKGLKNKK